MLRRSKTAKHRPGEWDLPGGFVGHGESSDDGVIREVFEETALVIDKPELIVRKAGFSHEAQHEFSYYRSLVIEGETVLSYEHDMYEWHEPLVASTMINYMPHKLALSKSL